MNVIVYVRQNVVAFSIDIKGIISHPRDTASLDKGMVRIHAYDKNVPPVTTIRKVFIPTKVVVPGVPIVAVNVAIDTDVVSIRRHLSKVGDKTRRVFLIAGDVLHVSIQGRKKGVVPPIASNEVVAIKVRRGIRGIAVRLGLVGGMASGHIYDVRIVEVLSISVEDIFIGNGEKAVGISAKAKVAVSKASLLTSSKTSNEMCNILILIQGYMGVLLAYDVRGIINNVLAVYDDVLDFPVSPFFIIGRIEVAATCDGLIMDAILYIDIDFDMVSLVRHVDFYACNNKADVDVNGLKANYLRNVPIGGQRIY